MEGKGKGLHRGRTQPDPFWPVQMDCGPVGFSIKNAVRGKLRLQELVEGDAVAFFKTGQQTVDPGKRVEPGSEAAAETLQRVGGRKRALGDPLHHAHEVSRTVLKLGHEHLQPVLQLHLFGGVMGDAADALHLSCRIEQREVGVADPAELAIAAQDAEAVHHLFAPAHPAEDVENLLAILGQDHLEPAAEMVALQDILDPCSIGPLEGRADIFESEALAVPDPEHVGRGLPELAEAGLAFPQRILAFAQPGLGNLLLQARDLGLRVLPVGDVLRGGGDAIIELHDGLQEPAVELLVDIVALGLLGHAGLGDALEGIEDADRDHARIALEQALPLDLAVVAHGGVVVQNPAEVDDLALRVPHRPEHLDHVGGAVHRRLQKVAAFAEFGRALGDLPLKIGAMAFLGVPQAFLGPAPRAHVGGGAEPLDDPAMLPNDRHRARENPADTSVCLANTMFQLEQRPGADCLLDPGLDHREVLGKDVAIRPGRERHLRIGQDAVSAKLGHLGPVRVHAVDHVAPGGEQGAEASLAVTQCGFRPEAHEVRPEPLGHLLHKRDILVGPAPRAVLVNGQVDQQPAVDEQGNAEQRLHPKLGNGGEIGAGKGRIARIVDPHGAASAEILQNRPFIVLEPHHRRERLGAIREPAVEDVGHAPCLVDLGEHDP